MTRPPAQVTVLPPDDDVTDPLESFDLAGFLPYRLAAAAARISRAFAERYREEFGISIPEWRVLAHLHHAGPVSVRDIEARADMEKSKASRAASRLEQAGYITKAVNNTDRRLLQLELTPQGRALMRRILPVAMQFQAEMRERLGPAAEGLDAALDVLLKSPAPPPRGD
ncbi:MAG: winged helix-turn-helix transcriptional regulator [Pararhodobacter sp.]|nr:winged helix-turn-helix transcriptional regulator [Pararhodobacter sp.]